VLTDLIEESGYDNVRSSLLKKAWDQGDTVVREVLTDAATHLGIAAGNLITLLGPNVIVLGGGVMDALGDQLVPIVRKAADDHTFPTQSYEDTKLELATLGDDAVALGAMAYGRARLEEDQTASS
jgi:glucokinase